MAKAYLSSTVLDLNDERRAVSDWLVAAGQKPVPSYVADSETVRERCLADIAPAITKVGPAHFTAF